MILRKLSLRSFRQYRQADVEFETGITAIVGANGSGKSTLLEAVSWSLYGEQRDVKETLKHLWSAEGGPPSVTMDFSVGGKEYRVERTMSNATLHELVPGEEPKALATGLTAVSKQSETLLHLTYEQFKNSFCTEQKQLGFLKFSAQNRQKDEVARMLGYDRLRIAAKTAKDTAGKTKSEVEGMRRSLPDLDELEARLKESQKEAAGAEERLAQARKNLEAADLRVQEMAPAKQEAERALDIERRMKERREVGATLKRQLESTEKDHERLQELTRKRDELKPKAAEYESASKLLKELQAKQGEAEKRRGIENQIADKEARVKGLEEELTALPEVDIHQHEKAEKQAADALAEAQGLFRKLRETFNRRVSEVSQDAALALQNRDRLHTAVKEMEAAVKGGKCPTCGQPLPEGRLAELSVRRDELAEAETTLAKATRASDEAKQEPPELAAEAGTLQRLEKARIDAGQALTSAKHASTQRAARLAEVEKIQREIGVHRKELQGLPEGFDAALLAETEKKAKAHSEDWQAFKSLSDLEERIEACEAKLKEDRAKFEAEREEQQKAKAELEKLGISGEEAEKLLKEFAEIESGRNGLMVEVAKFEGSHKTCANTVEQILKTVETGKEMRRQADELWQRHLLLDEVSRGLQELREQLNSQARPELESYAGAILGGLTEGRYSQVKLNDKFEPTVVDEGVDKKVISGGEEDVVALALRLALSQMIQQRSGQPMSLLILDEVFGSLDPERRQSVLERLDSLRDMFEQILMISHIESINESADRCLMVRYDPDKRCSVIEEAAVDSPALDLALK